MGKLLETRYVNRQQLQTLDYDVCLCETFLFYFTGCVDSTEKYLKVLLTNITLFYGLSLFSEFLPRSSETLVDNIYDTVNYLSTCCVLLDNVRTDHVNYNHRELFSSRFNIPY